MPVQQLLIVFLTRLFYCAIYHMISQNLRTRQAILLVQNTIELVEMARDFADSWDDVISVYAGVSNLLL